MTTAWLSSLLFLSIMITHTLSFTVPLYSGTKSLSNLSSRASVVTVPLRSNAAATSSSETELDVDSINKIDDDKTSFRSQPAAAYMEDIDAYGIMWHANYLTAYDRAIHLTLPPIHTPISEATSILDHPDWSIVEVQSQKFKTPLRLGDNYVVSGTLKSRDGDIEDVWDLVLHAPDDESMVYNMATVRLARPHDGPQEMFPNPDPYNVDIVGSYDYRIHRDELFAHLPSHVSLAKAMNIMERSRTNALGGPDQLRKMKEDDGIVWFVISANDLCLVRMNESCIPGQVVSSQLGVKTKRRGMVFEINHTLTVETADGRTERMAQGKINLMAFDERAGKPTNNIPEWCLKSMGVLPE